MFWTFFRDRKGECSPQFLWAIFSTVGSHSRIFGGDFLYSWDTTVQFLVAIFSSVGSTVQFLVAIFSTVGSAVQYDTCELAGGGAP